MMFTYQTSTSSTFSTPLLYKQPRIQHRKSGMHGTAATFGKINIYICAYICRFSSMSSIRLNFNTYSSYEVDKIEACDLLDSHHNAS